MVALRDRPIRMAAGGLMNRSEEYSILGPRFWGGSLIDVIDVRFNPLVN